MTVYVPPPPPPARTLGTGELFALTCAAAAFAFCSGVLGWSVTLINAEVVGSFPLAVLLGLCTCGAAALSGVLSWICIVELGRSS